MTEKNGALGLEETWNIRLNLYDPLSRTVVNYKDIKKTPKGLGYGEQEKNY